MDNFEELKNTLILRIINLYSAQSASQVLEMFEGELEVLAFIYKANIEMTPSIISQSLQMSRARITNIITVLESKQYVELKRSVSDRRKILIKLTSNGCDYIETKLEILDNKIINLLKKLGQEKSELFVSLLEEIEEIILNK